MSIMYLVYQFPIYYIHYFYLLFMACNT